MIPNSLKIALRRIRSHAALLGNDPERFGRNLMQVTHPALFSERLSDIMDPVPMHVRIDTELAAQPTLNVLSSALAENGMTGGPNTLLNLALRIARSGVPVRLVTTVESSTIAPDWFARHAAQLVGGDLPTTAIVTATEAAAPLVVGPHDMFMASHWTTAQQLKQVLPRMAVRQFFYMLQEFEPGFYAWSSNFALAAETFGMDFWPVVNEGLLAEYLFAQTDMGRLADPETHRRSVVFEPAIETRLFHPPARQRTGKPRLLFYARPSNTRNLFGLGLAALKLAVMDPVFDGWEFIAIGGRGGVPRLQLANSHVLTPTQWMDYAGYARSLQEADVLLCPMLSPHTSYPVLEMVATGGLSVTNSFATKTPARLAELSPDIVVAPPTVEGLAKALVAAAQRIRDRSGPRASTLTMAHDWAETLDPAAARISEIFAKLTDHAVAGAA